MSKVKDLDEILTKYPQIPEDLKMFLKIQDMKIDNLFNMFKSLNSRHTSLDETTAIMSEELEEFKEKLRNDFYNNVNTDTNEGLVAYQEAEGMTERPLDVETMRNSGYHFEFELLNPEQDALYRKILALCKELCPEMEDIDLYEFLSDWI